MMNLKMLIALSCFVCCNALAITPGEQMARYCFEVTSKYSTIRSLSHDLATSSRMSKAKAWEIVTSKSSIDLPTPKATLDGSRFEIYDGKTKVSVDFKGVADAEKSISINGKKFLFKGHSLDDLFLSLKDAVNENRRSSNIYLPILFGPSVYAADLSDQLQSIKNELVPSWSWLVVGGSSDLELSADPDVVAKMTKVAQKYRDEGKLEFSCKDPSAPKDTCCDTGLSKFDQKNLPSFVNRSWCESLTTRLILLRTEKANVPASDQGER